MVSLTRYWIFSTVFCSLCASSLQMYTDYGQADYDSGEENADDQLAPFYRQMLIRAIQGSYYSVPPPPSDTYDNSDESPVNFSGIVPSKRSRFYRKYPGKRQNRRVSDVYECIPNSRETVRLLYAIHQARQGDIDDIVFCNRVRNPKNLIPNPRYIGKRAE